MLTNLVLLSRLQRSRGRRSRSRRSGRCSHTRVIAGMIEYAFIYDHTRGTQLVIMTAMLVLFMLNVPLLIGFTVARFQRV